MADFLLELLSEEIPARMQAKARADLERLFAEQMADAGLQADDIIVYSTPRRLALIAKGLPEQTAAVSEEAKGPPAGAPDQAIDGFCRKNDVTRDQLELRDVKGRATYFAVINKPGRPTKDVLADAIPAIIGNFPWPKSMRWGAASLSSESMRWVRPLSGIVAIFGDQLVECAVDNIVSRVETVGHRFHHPGLVTIGGANDYVEKLNACHVLVDHQQRQQIISAGAAKAAADAGLQLVADDGLVIENAGLTECPVPLLGSFDPAFLDVPPEVIQLTTRVNQKYFICQDSSGALAANFICTANIDASDGGKAIVAGNQKVLAARLSDAKFFWELDQKTKLADHSKKLSNIIFHEKLGTVADKVERVAKLAEWLVSLEGNGLLHADPEQTQLAARLCKADLVTEMVGEFPELQGLMGGYYAEKEGQPLAVSNAISDHYKPVGQGDDVPSDPVTVAVSLADKLDSIAGFLYHGLAPTGSKDPFALRRAAIGVLRLIIKNQLRLDLRAVFQQAFTLIDEAMQKLAIVGAHVGDPARESLLLVVDRLKVQQREAGVRHDLIEAVFALGGEYDLVRLLARVEALQAFVATADGENLLAGYKRAANILKKEAGSQEPATTTDASYDMAADEAALIAALNDAEPKAAAAIEAEDFAGAMAALASLRSPIDGFFENVTVNDDDPVKRCARLALLARVRDAVHQVADFSQIEG